MEFSIHCQVSIKSMLFVLINRSLTQIYSFHLASRNFMSVVQDIKKYFTRCYAQSSRP